MIKLPGLVSISTNFAVKEHLENFLISFLNLKVCHSRCAGSIIQSCSVYISIYTYSHEHNNITISSDI